MGLDSRFEKILSDGHSQLESLRDSFVRIKKSTTFNFKTLTSRLRDITNIYAQRHLFMGLLVYIQFIFSGLTFEILTVSFSNQSFPMTKMKR